MQRGRKAFRRRKRNNFLRSSLGFFLCIVLPLILFFLYELYHFITILVTEKAKKNAGASSVSEEEIKRRAVEEYLAKQKDEEEIKRRAIEEYLAAQKAKENNEENNSENEDK
jgi:signal peptidase